MEEAERSLPELRRNLKNIGAVIKEFNVTDLPTGTIIVTRAYGHIVGYHSNDLHTHGSLLFWCSNDGTDRFSLFYEPGKTKPMTLELTTTLTKFSCNTLISDYPDVIKDHEYGHRPLDHLLHHPRYLDSVKKIIMNFPLMFMFNDCEYSFRHKYAPLVYPGLDSHHSDARDFFNQLQSSDNNIEFSLNNPRLTNLSCVDTLCTYVSLLHEALFINLPPSEIAEGKIPESKLKMRSLDLDIARLVNPQSSPLFEFFNKTPEKIMRGLFKVDHLVEMHAGVFLLPYILCTLLFVIGSFSFYLLSRRGRHVSFNTSNHLRK